MTLRLLVVFASLSSARHAAAQDSAGTLGLYLENDLFAGTDQHYTSGVKISWSSRDLEKFSDTPFASPFLPLFDLLPYINQKDYQKNLVFALGQNIYTPVDTDTAVLQRYDRPYAGWLYLELGVVWKDAKVRNSLVLDIGVVGSLSYAEETQRFIHDLRGFDSPKGWDNQLDDELAFSVDYEHMWRWPAHERRAGLDWEFLPYAGAALGTVKIDACLGSEFRIGLNLPDDFGTPSIASAAPTSTPVDGRQEADRSRYDVGAYVFTRVEGRAVARNIFLDGNTFSNSHSVDSNVFVADLSAGVAINYHNTKLAYALVYRTKEFDGQDEGQVFGTMSLNWTF
ncbi:lipid A deacylase LpxR family protein [Luteolibacter arcticus]|uniref:Lipid A deacylase LpxR family protein n=1 Tax=Luteolibacter arcticus TaxID=1581411 RepID=A0ABT3GQN5_9BACT|nr:lipid A deacylase LpxR family protein [Luteolibacter arcticus]MCW1925831.1 lipid A deacylase LpxR family protein [Luteolibacter arcticus]